MKVLGSRTRPLLLVALPAVLCCSGDAAQPVPVAAVAITSPTGPVTFRTLGRQVQFAAEARDAGGHLLADRPIAWTISDSAVLISSSGLVTASRPGASDVYAVADGVRSPPRTVTVDPLVVRVAITPDSLTFHTTARPQAVVIAVRDSSGAALPQTATLAIVDTTVAQISNDSNVVAVADGRTQLVARVNDLADTAFVRVALLPAMIVTTPPALTMGSHAPRTVHPAVADSSSHPLTGYAFAFASSDTTVVTVSDSGEVTPHGEGNTDLRIVAAGLTAMIPVSVRYVMYSVMIQPSPMTFYTLGRPQRARLYSVDSTWTILQLLPDSVPGSPRAITWHALGPYYTIVPADTGVDVYALYNGDYGNPYNMLNAEWHSSLEGYALIIVTLYPATFRLVAPQTDLAVGDTTIFTRVARDSLDNDLEGRVLFYFTNEDWSVVAIEDGPDERSVKIRALQPGNSWVRMFGGGAADSVRVTVH